MGIDALQFESSPESEGIKTASIVLIDRDFAFESSPESEGIKTATQEECDHIFLV